MLPLLLDTSIVGFFINFERRIRSRFLSCSETGHCLSDVRGLFCQIIRVGQILLMSYEKDSLFELI